MVIGCCSLDVAILPTSPSFTRFVLNCRFFFLSAVLVIYEICIRLNVTIFEVN